MDKSRQQFEAWFNDEYKTTMKDYDEPLIEFVMKQLFIVWQASRESLINNSEPVAWMYPVYHDEKMQFTTDEVASENIDIHFQSHGSPFKVTPLYKLD
ncbi:hypothetical protein V6L74_10535 [Proteus mirabilis]|uniref:hypothetical protein n=1 Tax=Proteus mirabilis TaxID=584 RepID=UPI002025796A|nr:hypothetical protein [Proteus mirabilis]MCL8575316.1 hypothetical protein [Proteus mirabilis]MCU9569189.1 hypothetical protein [Proteus mirabilis]HDT0722125.1 hypothetical protein [Proteus mirabilis]HEK1146867.1 hypothetical protein [Proteus mirabilis]